MKNHITLLGAMYIGFHIIWIFMGIGIYTALVGSGILSGDEEAMMILSFIGTILAFYLFIIALPGIIGGIALIQMKSWSRILILVLGFLNLLNVPLGTALGVYTIWVLMSDETIALFNTQKKKKKDKAE